MLGYNLLTLPAKQFFFQRSFSLKEGNNNFAAQTQFSHAFEENKNKQTNKIHQKGMGLGDKTRKGLSQWHHKRHSVKGSTLSCIQLNLVIYHFLPSHVSSRVETSLVLLHLDGSLSVSTASLPSILLKCQTS